MRQLSKSKKLVLAAGVGLTMLAFLVLSSSVSMARLEEVFGSKNSVRNVSGDDDDDDQPPPFRDLIVPESWAGQWNMTTTFNDALTGNLVASDEGTDPICPRDEVGLSAFITSPRREEDDDDHDGRHRDDDDDDNGDPRRDGLSARCTGQALDDRLDVDCSSRFILGDCTVNFLFQVRAERDMDQLTGQGEWRVVETSGNCAALVGQGETFRFSGMRLSRDLSGCSAAPSSLIEKFVQHPALILAMPAPIADLSAQGKNRKVTLSWTASRGASAYRIFRAAQNHPFELIAVRRARRGPTFQDHDVTNGVSYRYFIRWLDADGRQSPSSNEVTATPRHQHD